MTEADRKAMVKGGVWMTALSVGLCFVPVLNGLIAGLVGGYRIGSTRRALLAAAITAVVAGVFTWGLLALTLPRILGVSAGVGVAMWVLVSEAGLLSGAALGAMSHPAPAEA